MNNILNKINNLAANGFRDEDCQSLAHEYSVPELIDFYMENDDLSPGDTSKLENTIEALLKQPQILQWVRCWLT